MSNAKLQTSTRAITRRLHKIECEVDIPARLILPRIDPLDFSALARLTALLGHKTIENTARYLGIEEEQAIEIAEQFEI